MTLLPVQAFFLIAVIGIIFFIVVECIREHYNLSENIKRELGIAIVIYLTFFLISFSAFFGPMFFSGIGYTVNNTGSDIITAFDATSLFSSAILASVFAYMSIEMTRKDPEKKEEEK